MIAFSHVVVILLFSVLSIFHPIYIKKILLEVHFYGRTVKKRFAYGSGQDIR